MTPHGKTADLSVKGHVLIAKESCVILGANALVQWVLAFFPITTNKGTNSSSSLYSEQVTNIIYCKSLK